MKQNKLNLLVVLIILAAGCKKDDNKPGSENATVITANGDINPKVEAFKTLLGTLNTGTAANSGRREINWDAVPEDMLGKPLPDNFFNPTGPAAVASRQRGLTYVPKSGNFVVSKQNFIDINSKLGDSFQPFSGTNTFANTNTNVWPVTFQVPGETTPAAVTGFGAVFTDVDLPNSTSIEFFNGSSSIGKYFVPAHDQSNSFSFIGVQFTKSQKITRIEISHAGILTSGEADITNGGKNDLVALDDFFYAEPQPQQ